MNDRFKGERMRRRASPDMAATLAAKCLLGLVALGGYATDYYVDPSHAASRDGGSGTIEQPYRSLSFAVRQLRRGDRLVIAGGIYREPIDLRAAPLMAHARRNAPASARTIIEAASGAVVLIKGSIIVSDWEALGDGLYVKRDWSTNSQQVFVDGEALQQIGGSIFGGYPEAPGHALSGLHRSQGGIWPARRPGRVDALVGDSFYYDQRARALYVKVSHASLANHVVEVSVRPFLMYGQDLDHLTVRNLHFEHANTSALWHTGALTLQGNNLALEGLRIARVDAAGMDIAGNGNVIQDSVANYCGQVGMKVKGKEVRLISNETSYNNTRGFNKWWEAGGAKFVGEGGLQDSEVAGHRAYANNGDGIWFDWLNRGNSVHDVVSAYNTGFGIHYEASQSARILNNYVFGNGQRGIYLPHSSDSIVAHNLVAGNGLEAIVVIDEGRRDERGKVDLTPRGNKILANIVAWNAQPAIVLPARRLDNISDYNLFLTPTGEPSFSLGWPAALQPAKQGLRAWRAFSGQDVHSEHRVVANSRRRTSATSTGVPTPDWSVPLSMAKAMRLPEDMLAAWAASNSAARYPGPWR